jgi:hypothetical protein
MLELIWKPGWEDLISSYNLVLALNLTKYLLSLLIQIRIFSTAKSPIFIKCPLQIGSFDYPKTAVCSTRLGNFNARLIKFNNNNNNKIDQDNVTTSLTQILKT